MKGSGIRHNWSGDLEAKLPPRSARLAEPARAVLQEFVPLFRRTREYAWASYDLEEIMADLQPYFFKEATAHSSDYAAANNQPIICMRRI